MRTRGKFLAILGVLATLVAAAPTHAGPALVFEPQSGRVLHAYEPFQRWHPASLTKLMTLYLVFSDLESGAIAPGTPVELSDKAAAVTANAMGWPAGSEIRLDETIPILITKSANDIAVAVAETLEGSVDAFVARMNRTAAELGMTDTNFVNPHGLHDARQYTSAWDMAVLIDALIGRFPEHRSAYSVAEAEVRGQPLQSHNELLGRFAGADGIKTGYVCSAGWNIAASATRGGRQVIAIVFGALRQGQREEIAGELLEVAFAASPGSGNTRLADLERPAQSSEPVDMRPYACEGASPPAWIASYGLDHPPTPRPRPAVGTD